MERVRRLRVRARGGETVRGSWWRWHTPAAPPIHQGGVHLLLTEQRWRMKTQQWEPGRTLTAQTFSCPNKSRAWMGPEAPPVPVSWEQRPGCLQ